MCLRTCKRLKRKLPVYHALASQSLLSDTVQRSSSQMDPIHLHLPFEMRHSILTNFTHRDLCTKIAHVSTEWRRAVYDPSLWKSITLDGKNDWNWVLLIPKSNRESVRSVELKNFQKINNISLLVNNFPSVEEIKIRFANFLYNTWIKKSFRHIVRWDLKSISIPQPHPQFGETAALFVSKCKNIESVQVMDKESFLIFTKHLGVNLKRLSVNLKTMEPADCQLLSTCINLTDLHLSCSSDRTTDSIFVLKNFKFLQRLSLRGYYYLACKNVCGVLARLFHEDSFLHLIDINLQISVNDAVLEHLTKSCPNLRTLRILCDHEFSDYGLNAITTRLHNLERLRLQKYFETRKQFLDVDEKYCVISEECFMKMPRFLPFLTELFVDMLFELEDAWLVLERLKQLKPNLKILRQ